MKENKMQKGITLVALIITIIVLLILAVVTIREITGEGIIYYAKDAADKAAASEEQERIKLATIKIRNLDNKELNKENMRAELEKSYKAEDIEISSNTDLLFIRMKNKRVYEVDKNGNVTWLDLVKDTTPGILAGKGTEAEPYLIESIEDLVQFSKMVNEGIITDEFVKLNVSLNMYSYASYVDYNTKAFNEYFEDELTLMEELITNKGFIPIGNNDINYFSGNFDGSGKTIHRMYINRSEDYVGLFGYTKADIYNLNLKNCSINGGKYIGSCVGYTGESNIRNIESSGTIVAGSNTKNVGGIIGGVDRVSQNKDIIDIENIRNNISIVSNQVKTNIGGVIGSITTSVPGNVNIIRCSNAGLINSKGGSSVGGIVGWTNIYENSSTISVSKCFNEAKLSIDTTGTCYMGGLFGYLRIEANVSILIDECYNKGNIYCYNATGGNIGGIEGYRYWGGSTEQNTYNTGNIYLSNVQKLNVGGLNGYMNGNTTTNCYNIGEIIATNVDNCNIGGLIGATNSNDGRVKNCYYYIQSEYPGVAKLPNSNVGGKDRFNPNLKNMSEILGDKFITDTNNINNGYPILKWQIGL